ncbi:hypothetical protein NUW54_g9435 [Trametes sanguinea]|uniref:Uncharacterized protein n=1 Tax=Trametes sanguinea TaxID=158606 RepID=A0ACC1P5Z6_9APHY|nr:hypothetical protein NUW54_g9435 [Trametes sanguinea]
MNGVRRFLGGGASTPPSADLPPAPFYPSIFDEPAQRPAEAVMATDFLTPAERRRARRQPQDDDRRALLPQGPAAAPARAFYEFMELSSRTQKRYEQLFSAWSSKAKRRW